MSLEAGTMGIKVIERNLSDERVQKSIRSILRENLLCSMATVAPGNRSHINTAYFCYSQDFEFYFLSYPTSLHCRNLKSNPSMAMAIFSSKQTWGEPDRGLQLFGSCQEVRGPGEKRGRALYRERFPRYGSESPSLRQLRLYQFLPRRIKVFDEVEFGGGVFVNTYVRRGHR